MQRQRSFPGFEELGAAFDLTGLITIKYHYLGRKSRRFLNAGNLRLFIMYSPTFRYSGTRTTYFYILTAINRFTTL
jgi:hypothetical protein